MYFEVKNNRIERKNTDENQLEYIDPKICYFKFTTKEWGRKEKYVIFWTEKNKSIIKSIGKKCWAKIEIPKEINKKNFIIQIYVDNNLKTERYTIGKPILIEKEDFDSLNRKSGLFLL